MKIISCYFAFFLLFSASYVYAQCNLIYIGPAGGDWHTPANWNLCKVPGPHDIVTIPTNRHVRINNTNATCRTITVQAGGTVTRNGTGVLTVTNTTGAVACTAGCNKRVFLRTAMPTLTGEMGGLAGADNYCQNTANAVGLGGTWRAWLSTRTVNAVTRLNNGQFRLLNGKVVANSLADLVDGTIQNPITVDQNGVDRPFTNYYVYTGTMANGTLMPNWHRNPPTTNSDLPNCSGAGCNMHCNEWTCGYYTSCGPTSYSIAAGGGLGLSTYTDKAWTEGFPVGWPTAHHIVMFSNCGLVATIYCFEL